MWLIWLLLWSTVYIFFWIQIHYLTPPLPSIQTGQTYVELAEYSKLYTLSRAGHCRLESSPILIRSTRRCTNATNKQNDVLLHHCRSSSRCTYTRKGYMRRCPLKTVTNVGKAMNAATGRGCLSVWVCCIGTPKGRSQSTVGDEQS